MKTNVQHTSIAAYYGAVLATGQDARRCDRVMAAVLTLGPCTRRQIAEYFRKRNPEDTLAQEAAVSSTVYTLLRQRIGDESPLVQEDNGHRDPVTKQVAYLLKPSDTAKQYGLALAS